MKYLSSVFLSMFLVAGIFFSTGCSQDPSSIPSFVKIDTVIVDSTDYTSYGSIRHKINFAFFYVDDNFQGAYLLPAKFPVIGEGTKKITVYAGVYEFGNASTITRYIFYQPWTVYDTLVVQDTLVLNPHVSYDTAAVYHIQDFDSEFGSDFVTASGYGTGNYIYNYNDTDPQAEGLCGYMHMGAGDTTNFAIETGVAMNIPKGKVGYFLELDYKCNAPFYFDIKTSTGYRNIIGFNTKTTWNKAYINITYAMDVTPGTDVKLVFKMNRDASVADQEVFIDNVKLIHTP